MRTKILVAEINRDRWPSSSAAHTSTRSEPPMVSFAQQITCHAVSSAPREDTSASIDSRASDEEESFGEADDSFASFDARNSTMALLAAEHDGGGSELPSSVFASEGHVAKLEATANTYSPDFLDRLVDTLVGAPNFAKDMESSFAECDDNDNDLTLYGTNVTLEDTAITDANADATTRNESSVFVDLDTSDTSTESVAPSTMPTSTNNAAPKALRFTKIVGAINVPYKNSADDEEEQPSNIAASVLRRFSSSLSLSTNAKRSDGTEIATNIFAASKSREEFETCELKSTRSYLVEAGEDILIHTDTCTSVESNSPSDAVFPTESAPPPQTATPAMPTTPSRTPNSKSSNEVPPGISNSVIEVPTGTATKAPDRPPPSTPPALAALPPTNPKHTQASSTTVSRVEELLKEIYGPPRTEFGEHSSLIRAQLIVEKYNSRPDALIRVLEKKAAAKADVSACTRTSALEISGARSTHAGDQTAGGTPKVSNTSGVSFTRRLRSFGRPALKLRSRSRSLDRFRRGRSNSFDHTDSFSTPQKVHKKNTSNTPDTASGSVDENDYSDENETSFDPLSHIGFCGNA